ncbi:hypothetical protein SS50377_26471 [Spironucleus salmonicida]|uniref:Uncharacterized protein n=1 Tax=Spironucleus salmonicida TaxID=348837 RepID=V6LKX3_9EUKA|nr:hypothetical protein SS50377_26471 [Spironucleus salmonicida]|eukprot:EST41329.1 Hypothetical protein SS50377_19042 [Spironucleus salmonicida]
MGTEESKYNHDQQNDMEEIQNVITPLQSHYYKIVKQSSALDCEISNDEVRFDQQLINIGQLYNQTESGRLFDNYDAQQLEQQASNFKHFAGSVEHFIYQCGEDSASML